MISVLVVVFIVAATGGAVITRAARRTDQDIRWRGQRHFGAPRHKRVPDKYSAPALKQLLHQTLEKFSMLAQDAQKDNKAPPRAHTL